MNKKILIALLIILCLDSFSQATEKVELTWYGHAAFKLVTPQGHVLFIDPWITNPANPDGKADLVAIDKADLILVSHGHADHIGNAAEIAQKTQAKLVSTIDLGTAIATYAGYPKALSTKETQGNFGGTIPFFEGEVTVTFIPAVHSSAITNPTTQAPEYGGNPGGFLIVIQNGPTIYHTGDTDVFGDMALIPQQHPVDVMLACIGDHFTMGPERAAEAVALVNPKRVVPMHFGTFPGLLTGTPQAFKAALQAKKLDDRLQILALKKPVTF